MYRNTKRVVLLIAVVIMMYFLYCSNLFSFVREHSGYIHFSIDDSNDIFADLTAHSDYYDSIFQNQKLRYVKDLHDKYGIVVSFYVFYSWNVEKGMFSLSECTNRFKDEFTENAGWLRFGFHAKDELAYETLTVEEELKAPMKAAAPAPGSIGSAVSGPAGGVESEVPADNPFAASTPASTPSVSFNDPATQPDQSAGASKPAPKVNKTTLIALIVVAAMVVIALGAVLIMQFMNGNQSSSTPPAPAQPAVEQDTSEDEEEEEVDEDEVVDEEVTTEDEEVLDEEADGTGTSDTTTEVDDTTIETTE